MKIIDIRNDQRNECVSLLTTMRLDEYRFLIQEVFEQNGNLVGQRGVIKRSASAAKIRKRMNEDFCNGAIFPQVVIGLLTNRKCFEECSIGADVDVNRIDKSKLSIIDGMQRTNIYLNNFDRNTDRIIRVEFWITDTSVKLLYRMLVLNTGQVPWNTRRQIEVIYGGLADNILTELYKIYPEYVGKIDILSVDDEKRRTQPGKYQKYTMIEAYLGYNIRRVKVNVSEALANEFQRFDMMESLEEENNFHYFVKSFGLLCKIDFALSMFEEENSSEYGEVESGQFKSGKDIFTSKPACLGFMVACGEYVLGRTSSNRTEDVKNKKMAQLIQQVNLLEQKLSSEYERDNKNFLSLDSLNETVSGFPKSKIGDEIRELFRSAFLSMFRDNEILESSALDSYWRDYYGV